jgi:hypothetical protein
MNLVLMYGHLHKMLYTLTLKCECTFEIAAGFNLNALEQVTEELKYSKLLGLINKSHT